MKKWIEMILTGLINPNALYWEFIQQSDLREYHERKWNAFERYNQLQGELWDGAIEDPQKCAEFSAADDELQRLNRQYWRRREELGKEFRRRYWAMIVIPRIIVYVVSLLISIALVLRVIEWMGW